MNKLEAAQMEELYRLLKEHDEKKKQRKKHAKQLDLEVWIKEHEKNLTNKN